MTTLNIPSGYSWEDFELCRIPEHLHESAMRCIAEGDVEGFLFLTCSPGRMGFFIDNEVPLWEMGLYEKGLLFAFTSVTMDNRHFPLHQIRRLFRMADRERLLAAGDPLPGKGPFTIYRGVSGRGSKRWIRGMSAFHSQYRPPTLPLRRRPPVLTSQSRLLSQLQSPAPLFGPMPASISRTPSTSRPPAESLLSIGVLSRPIGSRLIWTKAPESLAATQA